MTSVNSLALPMDLWSRKSASKLGEPDAFYNGRIDSTPDTVGRTALYHSAAGVFAVQALIGHAMGDVVSRQAGIQSFIEASTPLAENIDLTLGRASTLLGCSLLLEVAPKIEYLDERPLLVFGDEVFNDIWRQVDQFAPIREERKLRYLGIAHGWAGVLYAAMRWCRSANRPFPDSLEEWLRQLAELAQIERRGARWKVKLRRHSAGRADDYMPGWCNGSAGHVFLWMLAYRAFADSAYLDLAEKAAWNGLEAPDDIDSLCCGLAGRAYGLLNVYKHTGEKRWLIGAQDLAARALAITDTSDALYHCLYKGGLGLAVLCADLARPDSSSMPLFEEEGWPAPGGCASQLR
jgi:eukaryotic-like serine/threonine-protein kinase